MARTRPKTVQKALVIPNEHSPGRSNRAVPAATLERPDEIRVQGAVSVGNALVELSNLIGWSGDRSQ